ncbi:MAG: toxin ParE1/3/4 [Alphaproteobacteria bacterium]|nr:toxin ParE1/3/4 [Alphaproteobacteria bacterium]
MQLLIADPAARDLEGVMDYIALDNPAAAEKTYRNIFAAANRLAEFPYIGRAGRLAGTREFSLTGLPYLLVYEISAEAVTIVAVFHTARDLVRALEERRQELKSS